jgi:hypothetical protein
MAYGIIRDETGVEIAKIKSDGKTVVNPEGDEIGCLGDDQQIYLNDDHGNLQATGLYPAQFEVGKPLPEGFIKWFKKRD